MRRSITSASVLVVLLVMLCSLFPRIGRAQPFVSVNHGLPNVAFGSFAVGDFDNDGDLDIALVGTSSSTEKIGAVYLNNGSGSFQIGPLIPAVSPGQVCWADYDGDGDLDLLVSGLAGNTGSEVEVTRLLRNDNGVLTDSGIVLPTLSANAIAFADFDHDGDLDLFIGGPANGVSVTYLLWKQGDQYVQSGLALPGTLRGATIAPADFDADGNVDLLLTPVRFNEPGLADFGTLVMRNKGDGTFDNQRPTVDVTVGITGAWHDFDLNGRLDLSIAGNTKWTVSLYDSVFGYWRGTQYGSVDEGRTVAGDYDRDGRPDAIVMGRNVSPGVPTTFLARNVGVRPAGEIDFTYPNISLVGLWFGNVAFADLDGDGDLDIVETGLDSSGQRTTKVYRNNFAGSFVPARLPDQFTETVEGSTATLKWSGPVNATTFNVRVGKTVGGVDIVSPMAHVATGRRRVVALGNAAQAHSFRIQGLAPGKYYWSVQSIDAAFNGSPFVIEREFTVAGSPELHLSIRLDPTQNRLIVTLSGTAWRSVIIQRSVDVQNWEDVGSAVNSDQELTFDRPADSKFFFRARVIPGLK